MSNRGSMVSRAHIFCETFKQMLVHSVEVTEEGQCVDLDWFQIHPGGQFLRQKEEGAKHPATYPLWMGQTAALPTPFPRSLSDTQDGAPWRYRSAALCLCFHRDLGIIKGRNPLDPGESFQPFILSIWWTPYFSSSRAFHLTRCPSQPPARPHTQVEISDNC